MTSRILSFVLATLLALVGGFAGAALFSASGLADRRTEAYLLDHPDLLPRMVEALQHREASQRLSRVGDAVRSPFPGAILGNPEGSKVLVEFSDYNCGYCRLSQDEVEKLVASDPQVKVVVREWPIFEGSEALARMALAAAKQGRFAAFHDAMFAQDERGDAAVQAAARAAGLDLARARRDAQGADIGAEIARNSGFAQELGFTGTPSWIADGRILEGAQSQTRLAEALSRKAP